MRKGILHLVTGTALAMALSVSAASVHAAAVAQARSAGLAVAAWTIRRRPTRQRLESLGVDALLVEGRALEASYGHPPR